ncbi:MAG: S-layer homology domain-containing protein [Microcoleus sp. SIO2G3]|nr:S-layer homology domain-containing protein [Microcoleus sp. SIO2G3]
MTRPASFTVSNYYVDAQKIPYYAVDDVAAATKANIVVNYPNQQILNPNQPATRGDIAAFIYQALVAQGKIEQLPSSVEASNYIVGRPTNSNQNTQTTQ